MRLNSLQSQVLKQVVVITGIIVLMKISMGLFATVLMAAGICYAISNKVEKAIAVYILYPFLAILNGLICPHMPMFSAFTRIGTAVMTLAMILSSTKRPGSEKIPIGGMFGYILVAIISSIEGYCPIISYLKIVNFTLFIIGLYFGVKNIHHNAEGVLFLRTFVLALIAVLIFGSICTLPFPAIAYSTTMKFTISQEGLAAADAAAKLRLGSGGSLMLFAGITNQSQCLAPLLVCSAGWVVCDMIVAEQRIDKLHLLLLAGALPLMYMTRSRVALLSLCAMGVLLWFFALPKARMSAKAKSRIKNGMIAGLFLIFAVACVMEIRNDSITKWLRKNEDLKSDNRGITEALTASRQGKIDMLMDDFYRKPMLGTGFQVMPDHDLLLQAGYISIFSAPVEKGVLPVMILGECGVAGAVMFALFLLMFYSKCSKKRYVATPILFTLYMATNMGEATFFSPSGTGGILWVISLVGGFVIDMSAKITRERGWQMVRPRI